MYSLTIQKGLISFIRDLMHHARLRYLQSVLVFFLSLVGLLTGCSIKTKEPVHTNAAITSHHSRYLIAQDAAPKGPIPTDFKKVVPVDEPFSYYGNPESYIIDGTQYHVLRTANGYKARGLASWYGIKFHSQKTSSGQLYNMYAMTAAHKTLPIPCYVKVKNLNNGREVIVKINDRGPFHVNRVIDLSYAAAIKLGIFPHGTAPVEITGLMGYGQKRPHLANYYIQIGVFSEKKRAEQLQKNIKQWAHAPILIQAYSGKYILKMGPFLQHQQAEKIKQQLLNHGLRGSLTVLQ